MRVDLYTKGILTIIAACLTWLCVAVTAVGTPVQAQASSAHSRVLIAGWVDASGAMHSLDPQIGTSYGLPVMMRSTVPTTATMAPAGPAAPAATPQTAVGGVTPSRAAAPSATERIRCQAATQRGTQCSRMAPAGQRFCWQHAR